ncbi:MAG: tetratricopeptide repeat protein, partial [Gammaproteobacteria bacterium]
TPERLALANAAALERAARSKAPVPTGNYAINLATSTTQPMTADVSGMAVNGERLYVMKSALDTGTVFRLRLGFFPTEAQAERALAPLRTRYPTAWVVKIGAADHESAQSVIGLAVPGVSPAPLSAAAANPTANSTGAEREPGALMAEARTAVLAGDFTRAAHLYTDVLAEPRSAYSQEARELLGVARQRNGEIALAIEEYRLYLKEYPDGEGADRVSQRLDSLTTARDTPKSGLRAATRGGDAEWNSFGSFSQYYRRDWGDFNGEGMTTQTSLLLTDGDFGARKRGEHLDFAGRATLGYDLDLLNEPTAPGSQTRIYDLYGDLYDRDWDVGVRVGRQTERSGGVLGRYDGAHVSYQLRPDIKLNFRGGFPVYASYDSLDTSRTFYGVSVDLDHLFYGIDTSFFFNTQTVDGVTDRQAVGTEMTYFDGARSVVGVADYDVNFSTLNILSIIGNWSFDSGLALSASADYRRSPFPLAENALIGQTAGSIDELLNSLTEAQIQQLAEDRSGKMLTYSFGASRPLAQRWEVNADFSITQIEEGPGSGGVLALPDSGDEYYVDTSLVGSSLFTEGDVTIFGLRYTDTYNTTTSTVYVDSRFPVTSELRLNPRLGVSLRDITEDSSSEWLLTPSMRLLYRIARNYEIDLEGGGELGSRTGGAVNTNTTAYYIYMGYRAEF